MEIKFIRLDWVSSLLHVTRYLEIAWNATSLPNILVLDLNPSENMGTIFMFNSSSSSTTEDKISSLFIAITGVATMKITFGLQLLYNFLIANSNFSPLPKIESCSFRFVTTHFQF